MNSDDTALRIKYVRLVFQLISGHVQLAYWRITSRMTIFRFIRYQRHLKDFAELAIVSRTPEGVYGLSKIKPAQLSTFATDATVIQPAVYSHIQQPLLQLIAEFADALRRFTSTIGATPGFERLAAARSGIMLGDGRIRSFLEPFNGVFINPFSSTLAVHDTPMAVAQALLDMVKKAAIMHVTPSDDAAAQAQRRRDLEATLVSTGDAARIRSEFLAILHEYWGLYRAAAIL